MGQGLAVLAISDPKAIRLLRANLRAGGYEVTTVHSSEKVKKLVDGDATDLLVLDEQLQESDGLLLCRQLREKSIIPIIIIGKKEQSAGVAVVLDSGADDFLSFPYSTDEFFCTGQCSHAQG